MFICWPEEKQEFSWFLTGLWKFYSHKSGLALKPREQPVYKEVGRADRLLNDIESKHTTLTPKIWKTSDAEKKQAQ